VVHEIVGHAVTLASNRLAELNRLFGQAVKRTSSLEALNRLSRVYWFTIEFGVLRENGALKAYGTGLLSSAGELTAMHNAELRPLDFETASRHEYDPTRFQPVLFCANSFDVMYESLRQFLLDW
jgi:phenylalanine-4-hydroxylase